MLTKHANNGELLPRFYGVAWFDWHLNRAVCLPLGLNVLVAIGRTIYFSVKHAGKVVMANPRDAYEQGLRAGRTSSPHIEPAHPWPRA